MQPLAPAMILVGPPVIPVQRKRPLALYRSTAAANGVAAGRRAVTGRRQAADRHHSALAQTICGGYNQISPGRYIHARALVCLIWNLAVRKSSGLTRLGYRQTRLRYT